MKKSKNTKKNKTVYNLVLSAMFLAIGYILPFFTGQIQQIGSMLLPMHIPVLLCGLICGWKYGLTVGAIVPITRSMIFGMPVLFPNAVAMAFELATYGFVVGFLFEHARWKCTLSLYRCLIIAMLAGRAVWGISMAILIGLGADGFTLNAFVSGALLNGIPGILLQLILIPSIMRALKFTYVPHMYENEEESYATE